MSAPEPDPNAAEASPADEMTHIPDEPLLPIEKSLILWSLVLGLSLLALLAWISNTFFTV